MGHDHGLNRGRWASGLALGSKTMPEAACCCGQNPFPLGSLPWGTPRLSPFASRGVWRGGLPGQGVEASGYRA